MKSTNWTVGHYALFRMLLGAALFNQLAGTAFYATELYSASGPFDPGLFSVSSWNVFALTQWPPAPILLLLLGAVMALMLCLGMYPRVVAGALWLLLLNMRLRNAVATDVSWDYVGWLLIAVALTPAPTGITDDLKAGRVGDERWMKPLPIHVAAWVVMSLAYTWSGFAKIQPHSSWLDGTALTLLVKNFVLTRSNVFTNMLDVLPGWITCGLTWTVLAIEVCFALLVLIRPLRIWIWGIMAALHVVMLFMVSFFEISFGMLLIHAFTFNPTWVRPRTSGRLTVFYDGACGFCHGFVRFVLAEEGSASQIRFAPLQGTSYHQKVPATGGRQVSALIVQAESGEVHEAGRAVLVVLQHLGGVWSVLGWLGGAFPKVIVNGVYRGVASVRNHLATAPTDLCPLVPAPLRSRFLP